MTVPRCHLRLVLWTCAIGAGCATRPPCSFETLGVPDPAPRPGHGAVVLGWEHEEREGWDVARVLVDGRVRAEWRRATQEPIVLYLQPGPRTLGLSVERTRGRRAADAGVTRLRLRPRPIHVSAGDVQLCALSIRGRTVRRPVPRCRVLRSAAAPDAPDARPDRAGDQPGVQIEAPIRRPGRSLLPNPFRPDEARARAAASGDLSELLTTPYSHPAELTERVRELGLQLDRLEEQLERILDLLRQQAGEAGPATEGS